MIDWQSIDTVLLDMDGTLLDLKYDNTLWNQVVPDRYCAERPSATEGTRQELLQHMMDKRHTLEFYCLDYWASYTGLEILPLHHELAHLIQYRPGAESFLDWLERERVRRILVTNAHRDSLSVKNAYSGLCFDASRTLLIDDSRQVLDAAAAYGIEHLLTVRQPDSARPCRKHLAYSAFNNFGELMPRD